MFNPYLIIDNPLVIILGILHYNKGSYFIFKGLKFSDQDHFNINIENIV